MEEEKKKSFSENAKNFLSDWKNEHANDNKDILERKKKRDEETAKLYADFNKELAEFKVHITGKTKELFEKMEINFKVFSEEFKKGTATISQKLQLEKRMDELSAFMKSAGEKGSEQFSKFTEKFKQKLDNFDKELASEKEVSISDEMEDLKKKAEDQIDNDIKTKEKEIDDMKSIFGDL